MPAVLTHRQMTLLAVMGEFSGSRGVLVYAPLMAHHLRKHGFASTEQGAINTAVNLVHKGLAESSGTSGLGVGYRITKEGLTVLRNGQTPAEIRKGDCLPG